MNLQRLCIWPSGRWLYSWRPPTCSQQDFAQGVFRATFSGEQCCCSASQTQTGFFVFRLHVVLSLVWRRGRFSWLSCDLFSTPADLDRKTEERVQVQSDKIQRWCRQWSVSRNLTAWWITSDGAARWNKQLSAVSLLPLLHLWYFCFYYFHFLSS